MNRCIGIVFEMYLLPIRTLILCVILPPFVYVFSLYFLEKNIQANFDQDLSATYLGDTRLLFDGSLRVQDALRENIDAFVARQKLLEWGVRATIFVRTQAGGYLYPPTYQEFRSDFDPSERVVVARENYRILNSGLIRTIDVKIEHNTWIANIVLAVCLSVSLAVLSIVYRRSLKKSRETAHDTREVIDTLSVEKQKSLNRLAEMEAQRTILAEETASLQEALDRQRRRANHTEEQMIDEMVALEDQVSKHLEKQESQRLEIEALKEKIAHSEKENETRLRQQVKAADALRKRFNTLYKDLSVDDRAIDGFLDLTEEMKIKAEEVIHQLNADSKKVPIKRKVFGKKNRETVFEVVFAYKGRLYFRNLPDRRSQILVIGTKLTQSGDLAFLNKR